MDTLRSEGREGGNGFPLEVLVNVPVHFNCKKVLQLHTSPSWHQDAQWLWVSCPERDPNKELVGQLPAPPPSGGVSPLLQLILDV